MKKRLVIGWCLLSGITSQAFASAGYAKDGLEFILFLVGFLLIVAALLAGVDYLHNNWKVILQRGQSFIRKNMFHFIRKLFTFRFRKEGALFLS